MGIVEGALIGLSAVSTLGSINEADKSRRASRKAQRVQSKIDERRAQRERIKAIREARIVNAQLDAQAASSGTQATSAVQGASANIQQQLGTNLSFVEQIQGLQQTAQRYQQDAASAASRSSAYGSLAGLSLQATNFVGNPNLNNVSETLGSSSFGYSNLFMGNGNNK